jgi:hypothetical protein
MRRPVGALVSEKGGTLRPRAGVLVRGAGPGRCPNGPGAAFFLPSPPSPGEPNPCQNDIPLAFGSLFSVIPTDRSGL